MLCSISERRGLGDGRGDEGWDRDGAGDRNGNGAGSEDVDELEIGKAGDRTVGEQGLDCGCVGWCPAWACNLQGQFPNAVTGGDDFCKQVGPACACGEGLGLWGKAGIEEEEEGPQKGSSGGQDILQELGGWGLEGCVGSESGAGHWKADEGAGVGRI